MAITGIAAMIAVSVEGSFDIPSYQYSDAANATYKAGAVLSPSGGNLIEATGASPTVNIAGVALQAGSNLASPPTYPNFGVIYPAGVALSGANAVSPLLFVPASDGVIFEAQFGNAGADVAINLTDLFVQYGITKDAVSGFWYVDKAKTAAAASCTIVGVRNPQDVTFGTTVGVRVLFKFMQARTIF